MIASFRPRVVKPRRREAVGVALLCVLVLGTTGFAQTDEVVPSPTRVRDALERPIPPGAFETRDTNLLQVVAEPDGHEPLVERPLPRLVTSSRQISTPPAAPNRGSRARRVTGAVLGAIGGFWIGAELGAALEGDSCNCDDPGMMGTVIGAPVGAAVGAVLGALVSGK